MSDDPYRRDYIRNVSNDPNFQMRRVEIGCGPLTLPLLIVLYIGLLVLVGLGTAHLSGRPVTFGYFWPMLPMLLLGQATALASSRIVRLFRHQKTEQEETQPWTLVALLLCIVLLIALVAVMPSIMTALGGPHVDAVPVWESLLAIMIGVIITQVGFPLYHHLRRKKMRSSDGREE
ncbi:hypothetical protein KDH_71870 [Dictyobacter sp. S3.2.2.5]|uniref:Uncharacterized protein n=1 Tax=Dictyobacter halimunensis TaxID=3026934 RepID=A0ABQ6G1G5_9CHLR|nr:hypothetical protein KDH_71870 [Dictyobacter sp. S3.2.2.5]